LPLISSAKFSSYMLKAKMLALGLVLSMGFSKAQELNCSVQINSQQIQGSERTIYDAMQRSVYEFINTRRWTNDKYAPHERIECSMLITIDAQPAVDQFNTTFQISSNRPVYGSTYKSTLFRYQDANVNFQYLQFDVLNYSDNAYLSNLTSVIAYYVYVILAYDYDSYSPMGGTEYWQKALQVVNNAQSSGDAGWQSGSSRQNRYWFVQYNLDPRYEGIRKAIYTYHRKGFDQMADNVMKGREGMLDALEQVQQSHQNEPNSFIQRLFFTAKHEELINVFKGGEPNEKTLAVQLLQEIDPANISKYDRIKQGGGGR